MEIARVEVDASRANQTGMAHLVFASVRLHVGRAGVALPIPGVAGSGWQPGSFTLTLAQANAITSFVDLRLRFRPSAAGSGQKRSAQVSWAEVQVPGPGDPASQVTYAYDRMDRLTGASGASGVRSYTYDPAGNRVTRTEGATTTSAYDRADRLTAVGATAVTVDAAGNLVARGADTFAFDAANRLTGATVAGTTEAYAYDGDGTRVSRQVGTGPLTRYVSDVNSALPVIVDDGTRTYVYGPGLAYAVSGSTLEVYHTDRLGSVRELTNASGAVTATYRTDEWGIPTQTTGGSTQPFGYTGEPRDGTGLSYLRARYYDAALGRFTSRDAWPGSSSSPTTLNRYAYVGDNPTTRSDPSGHCVVDTVADVGFLGWDVISLLFGPPKERQTNLTAFWADLVGAALPCVTGAGLWVRAGIKSGRVELKLSLTVAASAVKRPFVNSPHLVDMIMSSAKGVPDPQGVANALRWDVPGFFNGKAGTWQLVVDMSSNTVIHFNFVR